MPKSPSLSPYSTSSPFCSERRVGAISHQIRAELDAFKSRFDLFAEKSWQFPRQLRMAKFYTDFAAFINYIVFDDKQKPDGMAGESAIADAFVHIHCSTVLTLLTRTDRNLRKQKLLQESTLSLRDEPCYLFVSWLYGVRLEL